MKRTAPFVLLVMMVLGCSSLRPESERGDGAVTADANADSGSPVDSGPSEDVGVQQDVGVIDSGVADAGMLEPCGNDRMDPGETCDDGNTVSGDGCSAVCLDETVFCRPQRAGSLEQRSSVGRMVAEDGFVYVVTDFGAVPAFPSLRIIDAQALDSMREVGSYSFAPAADFNDHTTIGIAKRGPYVWVGGERPEFWSVNVSDPTTPVLGHQGGPNFSDGHLEIVGDRLYISYQVGETARVFDISAGTTAPPINARIGDRGSVYYNVTATESHAFVSNFTNGIDIVDVSGLPADPPVVGRYTHATSWSDGRAVRRLTVDGNTLAFVISSGPAAGVHLVNISLVTAPRFAATIAVPSPTDIALSDGFLYIAVTDGLRVYDVSDSANPRPAGSFVVLQAFSTSVALDGDIAYLGTDGEIFAVGGLPGLCDATCGNNVVEYPEDCDDGNLTDGDRCSAECRDE